jgi:hypothetical protein
MRGEEGGETAALILLFINLLACPRDGPFASLFDPFIVFLERPLFVLDAWKVK